MKLTNLVQRAITAVISGTVTANQGTAGAAAWLVGMSALEVLTASIADGASLSGAVDTSGRPILKFVLPASVEGTVLTFQVSDDGITYSNLYDEYGAEVTVTRGSSVAVRVNPAQWAHSRYWKVRTGTAGTPTVQTGANSVGVVVRGM